MKLHNYRTTIHCSQLLLW